jgi:hypothetical protein
MMPDRSNISSCGQKYHILLAKKGPDSFSDFLYTADGYVYAA